MINNQIVTPVKSKEDLFTGQGTGEAKKDESQSSGGLFKLLMNSIQGGKNGNNSGELSQKREQAGTILGGNILTNPNPRQTKDGEEVRLADIMAGLDEETRNELAAISLFLNDSEKNTTSGKDESPGETDQLSDTGSENSVEMGDELENSGIKSENEEVAYSDIEGAVQEDQEIVIQAETDTEDKSDENIPEDGTLMNPQDTEGLENKAISADIHTKIEIDETATENSSQKKEIDVTNEKPGSGNSLHTDNSSAQSNIAHNRNGQAVADSVQGVQDSENTDVQSDNDKNIYQNPSAAKGDVVVNSMNDGEPAVKNENPPTLPGTDESNKETQNKQFQFAEARILNVDSKEVQPDAVTKEIEKSTERVQSQRERGVVNQLRALAGSQPFTAQPVESRPMPEAADTASDDNQLIQKMFADLANGNIDQQAAEVRSLKANQIREIRYKNYQSSFSGRQENSFSGTTLTSSAPSSATVSEGQKLNMVSVSGIVPAEVTNSTDQIDEDAVTAWKEHIAEYFESKEKVSAEQASALTKLNDFAVTNISVRRNFALSLGQAIMSATGDGKKAAETWQKHTFKLENGNNIQLSAREVDGVLQLRLNTSNSELNKLLMDHQDEIREHLDKEINISIDLQLDTQAEGQAANFFSNSGRGEQRGSQALTPGSAKTKEQHVDEVVPKAVRKFGYNQMEWTA